MSNNSWLSMNVPQIEKIKRVMIECEYRPEFRTLPVKDIQRLFNGATKEIERLQRDLDTANVKLDKYEYEEKQTESNDEK